MAVTMLARCRLSLISVAVSGDSCSEGLGRTLLLATLTTRLGRLEVSVNLGSAALTHPKTKKLLHILALL
jgi:hypothetical protein